MQSVWMGAVHQVLLLLLQLVVFGIIVWVHRLLPLVKQWMQHHLTERERRILSGIGREAYIFAESAFAGQPGGVKLEQAMNYALSVIGKTGLTFSPDEVRAAVETAVKAAKQSQSA